MAQSYSEVVRDALQMINVIADIDTPSAEQGQHGLRVLNDMMAHWVEDGLDVEYVPSEDLTADIDVDVMALRAIKANLAIELAAQYPGVQVTPQIAAIAQSSYEVLYRNRFDVPELDMTHLHRGDRPYDYWDIEST